MELKKFKEEADVYTKSTSDIVRQLAFAGIAIVWIFKIDKPINHLIPPELTKPLLSFSLCLIADLLQYLIPSIIWTAFYLVKEKEHLGNTDADVKANLVLSIPGIIFYIIKVILVFTGYYFIAEYLLMKL